MKNRSTATSTLSDNKLSVASPNKDKEAFKNILRWQAIYNEHQNHTGTDVDITKNKSVSHLLHIYDLCHKVIFFGGASGLVEHILEMLTADLLLKSWTSCREGEEPGIPAHEVLTIKAATADNKIFQAQQMILFFTEINDELKDFQIEQLRPQED